MATFETETTVRCPAERAFEFLTTPRKLPLLALPEANLIIEKAPDRFTLGAHIEFAIQVMGTVVRATHEIVEFDAPTRFVETQIKGPFAAWRHEHLVRDNGDGTVTLGDVIEFERPGGLVGLLMTEARIREQLEDGFEHRAWKLKTLLEKEPA